MPRYSWDETKRLENIRRHGLDFEDVSRSFEGPSIDQYDADHSETEDRWRRRDVWLFRGRSLSPLEGGGGQDLRLPTTGRTRRCEF